MRTIRYKSYLEINFEFPYHSSFRRQFVFKGFSSLLVVGSRHIKRWSKSRYLTIRNGSQKLTFRHKIDHSRQAGVGANDISIQYTATYSTGADNEAGKLTLMGEKNLELILTYSFSIMNPQYPATQQVASIYTNSIWLPVKWSICLVNSSLNISMMMVRIILAFSTQKPFMTLNTLQ